MWWRNDMVFGTLTHDVTDNIGGVGTYGRKHITLKAGTEVSMYYDCGNGVSIIDITAKHRDEKGRLVNIRVYGDKEKMIDFLK
jgi:hypothetical protein